MTDKPDDGGPAFPLPLAIGTTGDTDQWGKENAGMSLRAWLAGMAMQELLANSQYPKMPSTVSVDAIEYADALIAELEKDR